MNKQPYIEKHVKQIIMGIKSQSDGTYLVENKGLAYFRKIKGNIEELDRIQKEIYDKYNKDYYDNFYVKFTIQ